MQDSDVAPAQRSEGSTLREVFSARPAAWTLLLFYAAYVGTGTLCDGLSLIPGVSIIFWPPVGILIATLLLTPRPSWPWWIAAGCAAELTCNALLWGNPLQYSLIYYTGNALEALTAAWLIGRFAPKPFRFESIEQVLAFLTFGAGFAPIVSATVIAAADAYRGKHLFTTAWPLVWLGDATGMLVSAPITFVAVQTWRERADIPLVRFLEAGSVLGLMTVIAVLSLSGTLPTVYMTLPMLLWIAVRFGLKGAAAALGVLAFTTGTYTAAGFGQFAAQTEDPYFNLIRFHVFLGVSAISALFVAALSQQRKITLAALEAANRELEHRVVEQTGNLVTSEARLRLATQGAGVGTWEVDLTTGLGHWSPEAVELFGIDRSSYDSVDWVEAGHPEDRARIGEAWKRAIEENAAYEVEFRSARPAPDGGERWLLSRGSVERDVSGRAKRGAGVLLDITELRRVRTMLGEQSAQMRLITDAMPALISYIDTERRYQFINVEYEKWFGLDQGETIGRTISEVLGEDAQVKVEPFLQRVFAGEDVRFEAHIHYQKAGWKWVEAHYIPDFAADGSVRGFFGLVIDITERKELESRSRSQFEELESIYAAVPVGLAVIDRDLRFVRVNDWLARHNGVTAAEHAGRPVREVVPELAEQAQKVLQRVIETGEPVRDVIIEGETAAQPSVQRAWQEIWSPVKDDRGEVVAVSVVVEDVTENRWAESLIREQSRLFEMIAAGRPLKTVLTELTAVIDRLLPLTRSAVLVADKARCEFVAAYAANIPETYTAPLKGVKIKETPVGTCCEAVYKGLPVTSKDVASDTRWTDAWRELCLSHGIRACHSEPIIGEDGRPLGTVVLGFDTAREPDERGLRLVRLGAQVAGVAIDRDRAEAALRLSEERLRLATAAAGIYTWEHDPMTGVSYYSPNMANVLGFELPENSGNANLYIHPHDRERVMGDFAACFTDGQAVRSEYRFLDPATGKTAWVATHGRLVPTNGRPARAVGITQNITERKLAEERLRAGERETHEILESITDAFFSLDSEWRFSYTNRQAELVLGREPGSLIGKVIWDEYPGLIGSKFETAYRAAMDEGTTSTLTDYYPDHGRWYEVHVYPRRSAGGVRGVSVYFQNATERVTAEQAIRKSESTFRQLVEASPFGIYVVDSDFKLASVSTGAQKVFENVRPLIGRDFAEVLRVVWEEPFATQAIEIFRHTLATGEPYHAPRTVETREDIGAIESYDWKVERITMPDGRYGVVCHFYDLSERIRYELELREAELRFRSTFEQAAVGIAQVDPEGRWMLVNDRLCEILGYSREEMLERSFQDMTHPDDIAADLDQIRRTLMGEIDRYAMNKRYLRKGGEVVWVNLTVSLVRDADGAPKYFVSVVQDITEVKRAEAAIISAAARDDFRVKLADAIRTLDDPDEVKKAATRLLGERLGVNRVFHAEVLGDDWLVVKGYETGVEPMRDGAYSAEDFGHWIMETYRRGERIVFRDTQNDPRFSPAEREAHKSIRVIGAVGVPFVKAGELLAILAVHTAEPRDWSEDEIAMVEDTAERTWAAIERARAEKELIESEQRYRFATRATHDVIWDWDMVRDEVVWSDALDTVFGYPPDHAGVVIHDAFEWWTDKIHPDDRAHIEESFARAREVGRQEWYEKYRFRRADGTYADVEDAAFIVYDADGEPIRITGAMSDVSERTRAEEALRASEDKYRVLFDSMDEGYCIIEMIFDEDGRAVDYRFVEVNSAFERQAGMQDVVGKRMLEFVPAIESHWLENYGSVARTGVPVRFANEYKGLGKWFDVYAFRPAGWDGPNIAVLFTDITERKLAEAALSESEQRFRNMADNAPVMIWVTEPDGYCTYLSQSWYEFTGQKPAEGLGYGWLAATHPDDARMAEDIFRESNAKCEPFKAEYRLRGKDGDYRWVIDSAQPRFSESGVYLGYIGSVIDIHERKEAEEQRRRDRERFDIVRDGAEVGFWFCDLPFDELIWDNRVKEHFWLPPDAHVTIETFYDRIHPDDRERTREAIAASNANKTQYDIEYRTTDPSGDGIKWIRAIGRTFYDKQGGPIRFDGVTLDITERKLVEDALRGSEELLASTFSGVEAAITISEVIDGGREFRILNVNRACAEWTGIPVEQWVGRRLHDFLPRQTADGVTERYRAAVQQGQAMDYEEMVAMPAGDVWALTTVTPLRDKHGAITRVVATSVNITKRKEAERALQESERFARQITDVAPTILYIYDMDEGRNVWGNREMTALLGYTKEQIRAIGPNLIGTLMHPDDQVRYAEHFQRILKLADGDGAEFEYRMRAADGEWRWLISRDMVFRRGAGGTPSQIVGAALDVTERKLAEDALRSQTELLRAITESTPDLIFAKDASGRLIMANKATLHVIGQTEESAIGRLDSDLYDPMEADLIMANDRRVMQSGRTETLEEVVTTDGEARTYLTTKNPLRDAEGGVIGVVGVSHDITALKRVETALRESEMRHRLALESGNMGTWTMPMDGRLCWADEQTLALFDIPVEDWTGDAALIRARRLPEDQEVVNRTLAKAIAERSTWRSEFRVQRRDGSIRWLAGVGRIEFGHRGEPVLMRGINFDITERKQAEEELRGYHEMLEATVRERTSELAEANRELKKENRQRRIVEEERQQLLGQLVAAQEQERRRIAQDLHDHLGQQLTALNLKLEIALQAATDDAAANHLHEAKAMMRQIDDDVDALAWQLRPAILDDDGFLPALRKYVEDWSTRYGVPAELWADSHFENHNGLSAEAETNLYRITQEALNNVAKYARAGRVEVLINKRGDSVVLTVQDDGAGFEIPAVAARTEKNMGLIGMRERAGLVGGTFQIESSLGEGTSIYVRVPFNTSDEHDGSTRAAGS